MGTLRRDAPLDGEREPRVGSESDLRALATRLLRVREEQLSALAREIHDVFGQELTVLKVDVAWLARRLVDRYGPQRPEISERITAIEARLDALYVGLRTIATDLRPRILDDLGLIPAIAANAQTLARRTGLVIEVVTPDDVVLDRDLATALFRIYQELVTNVLRHARATRVEVALTIAADSLELRVVDDGIGFAPVTGVSTSLGLLGIRERALAFGGAFAIGRGPTGGTVATLTMPRRGAEHAS